MRWLDSIHHLLLFYKDCTGDFYIACTSKHQGSIKNSVEQKIETRYEEKHEQLIKALKQTWRENMSGLIYWTKSKHTRSLTPCRRKLVATHVILKYITWHLCLLLWNRELSYTWSVLVGGILENQITLYSMHIIVFTLICLSDFLRCPWSRNAYEHCPLTAHGHFMIEKIYKVSIVCLQYT